MDLKTLLQKLKKVHCNKFYIKKLAQNNNNKQQIYLGSGFENQHNAVNLLSYELQQDGSNIYLHGTLDFFWMNSDGLIEKANDAKLIYYKQYPEVRLSGFLKGCKIAPRNFLSWEKNKVFPDRILVFGITPQNTIIAFLAVKPSQVYDELLTHCKGHPDDQKGVLYEIKEDDTESLNTKELLISKIDEISRKGWIKSQTLTKEGIVACTGNRCVGLTLESQLGITQNSSAKADFWGWELKTLTLKRFSSRSNKRITIIEPQPTGGMYVDDIKNFFNRFGHSDAKNSSRINFNGTFNANSTNSKKGLKLKLDGLSSKKDKFDPTGKLLLVSDKGEIAAEWSFLKLREHWVNKHSKAAFIPALKSKETQSFMYSANISMGEGTTFLKLLNSLDRGQVFLDPACWKDECNKVKHRNMFRIKRYDLPSLYEKFETKKE